MCLCFRLFAIPLRILPILYLLPAIALGSGREETVREEIAAYGDYRFVMEQRVVHHDEEANELLKIEKMEAFLIVYKDDREVFRSDEGYQWAHSEYEQAPEIGEDITGDGSPDVVLVDWSGGIHCCYTYYIFELREPLNVMIFAIGNAGIDFKNLDGKPGLEAIVGDNTFAYWKAPFVGSAFPDVVLSYRNGRYAFDDGLTRKSPLTDHSVRRHAFRVRTGQWNSDPAYPPEQLLHTAVNLIYGGNAMQALDFIEAAWRLEWPGKDDFIAELFHCQLRLSPWWPQIARLNALQPEDAPDDCGKRFRQWPFGPDGTLNLAK